MSVPCPFMVRFSLLRLAGMLMQQAQFGPSDYLYSEDYAGTRDAKSEMVCLLLQHKYTAVHVCSK